MKSNKNKKEKDRQIYDTKERIAKVETAKKKVEEGDNLLHKAKDIYDETERDKLNERSLEVFRSAVAEMLVQQSRHKWSRETDRRNILPLWNSQHVERQLPQSYFGLFKCIKERRQQSEVPFPFGSLLSGNR